MERWAELVRLLGIGWYIVISLVAGVALGVWADRLANTNVLFTLIGLFMGLVVATFGAYRMLMSIMRNGKKKGQGGEG